MASIRHSVEFRAFAAATGRENVTEEEFLESLSPYAKEDFLRRFQTSDDNLRMEDELQARALKNMGREGASVDELNDEDAIRFVDELGKVRMEVLEFLPPKFLVNLSGELKSKIATAQGEEKEGYESRLRAVQKRMDDLIKDCAKKEVAIEPGNIAHVYDGMVLLLNERAGEKELSEPIAICRKLLEDCIAEYDKEYGLDGLTEESADELEVRRAQAQEFVNNIVLSKETKNAFDNLNFVDDKGNPVPQKFENGNVISESELETLYDIIRSQVLNELTVKGDITQERANDLANRYAASLITSVVTNGHILADVKLESIAKEVGKTIEGFKKGNKFNVTKTNMVSHVAGHISNTMGFLQRLGSKVGKSASVVKNLYTPIARMDDLAKKRWGKDYTTAKNFTSLLGKNLLRGSAYAAVSNVAARIPPMGTYVGIVFAMDSVRRFAKLYKKQKEEAAQNGEKYGLSTFVKRNSGALLMTAASTTATFCNVQLLADAVRIANVARSGIISGLQTNKAKGGKSFWKGGWKSKDFWSGFGKGAAMGAATAVLTPAISSGMDVVMDNTGLSDAILNFSDKEVVIDLPGSTSVSHDYSDKAMEIAEARNNGEGRYDATGSYRVDTEYSAEQLNTALDAIRNSGVEEFGGNEQMIMYKMYQAHLLGSANAPVIGGESGVTLGDVMGVTDADGNETTFQDTYKKLIGGEELSAADMEVMKKVEMCISGDAKTMGQLIPDVGLDGTWSYNTQANAGLERHEHTTPGEKSTIIIDAEKVDIIPYLPFDDIYVGKVKARLNDDPGSLGQWFKKMEVKPKPKPKPDPIEPIYPIIPPKNEQLAITEGKNPPSEMKALGMASGRELEIAYNLYIKTTQEALAAEEALAIAKVKQRDAENMKTEKEVKLAKEEVKIAEAKYQEALKNKALAEAKYNAMLLKAKETKDAKNEAKTEQDDIKKDDIKKEAEAKEVEAVSDYIKAEDMKRLEKIAYDLDISKKDLQQAIARNQKFDEEGSPEVEKLNALTKICPKKPAEKVSDRASLDAKAHAFMHSNENFVKGVIDANKEGPKVTLADVLVRAIHNEGKGTDKTVEKSKVVDEGLKENTQRRNYNPRQ